TRLPSFVVALSCRPSMTTLAMRPLFTSSMNCEYSIGAWAAWRVLNWLNTVISTRPITSQMTKFFSILFKDLLLQRRKLATILRVFCAAQKQNGVERQWNQCPCYDCKMHAMGEER